MKQINIVYDSKTGNVERFINRLRERLSNRKNSLFEWKLYKIEERLKLEKDYHLITYTTNFGQVPFKTKIFLENNHRYIRSVSSSGNMNWGPMYGKAANKISEEYNVPILVKFELSGTQEIIEKVIGGLESHYGN